MKLLIIIFLIPLSALANCKDYYFSLDFGGRVGDGLEITDYLVKEKVPHVIFMVGYNLESAAAKELCKKINTDANYRKYIKVGNHTKSHRGFEPPHKESYIRDEIVGNESLILQKCTTQNFVKVFRYPKGQSHPIAEKILEENSYTSQYTNYSDDKFRTKMGVGWTSDTRDWVEEGSASMWAQNHYYNKHSKFMPVNEKSGKEFKNYVMELDENTPAKLAFDKGLAPEIFNKNQHQELDGWHGPTEDAIVNRILFDKGVDGKCVPLTHFGGFNTLGAFKRIIPKLKQNGKEFKMLDDNLDYAVKSLSLIADGQRIDPTRDIEPKSCNIPSDIPSIHVVKPGETLFGISQKYGIDVESIKKLNNLSSNEIDIDQKLKLQPEYTMHKVRKEETLYRISKTYDVSVDKIIEWNGLGSNEIEIDQKLKIMR